MKQGFAVFRKWCFFILLLTVTVACQPRHPETVTGKVVPLARLARHGFAINKNFIRSLNGRIITIRGYLDAANIALRSEEFPDLPSGMQVHLPDDSPYFNLKARIEDNPGDSVRVLVSGDPVMFHTLFSRLLVLARSERPKTPIIVTGRLHSFDAPMNFVGAVGFQLEVKNPSDIVIVANNVAK